MPRNRRGSLWKDKDGNLYGRVTLIDDHGKRLDKKRKAKSGTKREAWNLVSDMLKEIDSHGEQSLDSARMSFKQLADHYKTNYLIAPTYDEKGTKLSGLRSYKDYRNKLKVHVEKFGHRKIRSITYAELKSWRNERLNTPTPADLMRHRKALEKHPDAQILYTRALASVNRELTVLHRAFSIAYQNRWILRNPFDDGDPLFDMTNERMRERIATDDEEERLLAACIDGREHLRPFLVCAFDTGMRASEMYGLTPEMVDFDAGTVMAVSYKGKGRRVRLFRMTPRLTEEMHALIDGKKFKPGETVFKYKSFKRSFVTAKKIAGMEGFRLHDARHTTATRLVNGNMGIEQVGKLLGHTNPKTTWRYVHVDSKTQDLAAEILSRPKKR